MENHWLVGFLRCSTRYVCMGTKGNDKCKIFSKLIVFVSTTFTWLPPQAPKKTMSPWHYLLFPVWLLSSPSSAHGTSINSVLQVLKSAADLFSVRPPSATSASSSSFWNSESGIIFGYKIIIGLLLLVRRPTAFGIRNPELFWILFFGNLRLVCHRAVFGIRNPALLWARN